MRKTLPFLVKKHLKLLVKNTLLVLVCLLVPNLSNAQLLKFVAYGDSRTGASVHSTICTRMNTEGVGLIIHSGDMYDGYTQATWLSHFTSQPNLNTLLNNNKILVAYGNHESASIVVGITPSVVRNNSGTYSFREGNVFFVCAGQDPSATFIETELKKPEATSADFRVLFFHYPIYSKGNYTYSGNTAIEAVCDKYNVTFTFSGHDHSYQRSKVLYNKVSTYSGTNVPAGTKGTTYIVTGGAGAPLYTATLQTWGDKVSNSNHYCVLSSYSDRIELVVKNSSGTVIETFVRNIGTTTNYSLTTGVVGSGSIALSPTGGTYASGTVVILTPTPAAGYAFSGWSGDLTGSANPATITMNANKSVTATFTSSALVPSATTVAASDISTTGATLNGTVNANNASTTVTFEYGLTTSYGSTTNGTPNTVTGATATSVTGVLTGLTANTTYNYRVKAVNSVGTTYGSNMTFTTQISGGAVVTVGTGTSTQGYPINCYYGYERSASIYTATEIGAVGSLTKVGWYPTATKTTSVPIKIYIKHTTASTITAATWATSISGATLVYSGTMAGTTANAWKEFTLTTPFSYTGGTNNLMVLVETNYGGAGVSGGTSAGPAVRYTSATSKHMYIRTDNTPPTGNGKVTSYRPNIRLTFASGSAAPNQSSQNKGIEPKTEIHTTISVYPNPTYNTINIKLNNGLICGEAKIFNSIGALVKTVRMDSNEKTINVSELPTGVYIISVDNQKTPIFTRFVKK